MEAMHVTHSVLFLATVKLSNFTWLARIEWNSLSITFSSNSQVFNTLQGTGHDDEDKRINLIFTWHSHEQLKWYNCSYSQGNKTMQLVLVFILENIIENWDTKANSTHYLRFITITLLKTCKYYFVTNMKGIDV